MSEATAHQVTDDDRKHFKQLILLALLAMLVSAVVGAIGGWMVLADNEGERIPYLIVLMPLIVCCIVTMGPLYFVRKRWFPTKEALEATVQAVTGKEG